MAKFALPALSDKPMLKHFAKGKFAILATRYLKLKEPGSNRNAFSKLPVKRFRTP